MHFLVLSFVSCMQENCSSKKIDVLSQYLRCLDSLLEKM